MRLSKRWTRALAATAVVAAVLVGAPAAQAVATYTLTGTVTDRATGAPVPGACLDLYTSPYRLLATRCADEQGRYLLPGVTADLSPKLRARATGHAEVWWPSAPDYYNAGYLTASSAKNGVLTADLALADAVGGFAGRITQPDGSPAYASEVTAVTVDGKWRAKAPTDSDGRYRLGNLPVGSYRLGIAPQEYAPRQWVPGTTDPAAATAFQVTAGSTTTVDERYLVANSTFEGGVLTGTVTAAATGTPITGACVTAFAANRGNEAGQACTDATGRYRLAVAAYASYKLRVRADGFPEQWAPNAVESRNAPSYTAQYGKDVVVDVALRVGGGTVRGQITDYPGATPALTNSVRVFAVDNSWSAWTEAVDGRYQFDRVPPGDYRVAVKPLDRTIQYHPGKSLVAEATVVHVADGEVTTVDEQLLPPGAVEVTLVDAVTGAPVAGCVRLALAPAQACADSSGRVTFPKVWATGASPETVTAVPGPTYWQQTVGAVQVVSGETTRLTIPLEPAAALETTVVDATTGAAVPNACVRPVNAAKLATSALRQQVSQYTGYCSDAEGKVRIGPLPGGVVQLLVTPPVPYGTQWYTETGGTGDRRLATAYPLKAGRALTAPPVRLDQAGSITGTMRDESGGAVKTCVQVYGDHPDLAYGTLPKRCTYNDSDQQPGQYKITGLGPYRWPIFVAGARSTSDTALAPAWSGNAADRFAAAPVQVTAGATATAPGIVLVKGARIRTFNLGSAGGQGTVEAFHPTTGDRVAFLDVVDSSGIGLPAGPVLLFYRPVAGTPCWYVAPRSAPRTHNSQGPTPITLAPGQVIDTLRLVPGETCMPVQTAILPR
ncbi:carboxypeptidase regulatory-like domain-containing protein [Micromonospora sp. NPDC048930]|uniref:carboxypeptidase regulatory-like domain-containing protein n=1 Tax=Micromonospora sp. NPDC048930 TaxID=3364261 RepID=UPI003711BB4C